MSQDTQANSGDAAAETTTGTQAPRTRLGRWTKVLLVAAVALMLAGLALGAWGRAAPARDQSRQEQTAKSFVSTAPAAEAKAEDNPLANWSGPLFRLGFSFVVGFCVAFALRAVFRLAVIFLGLIVLVLFGLQYAGVVVIDWAAIGGQYNSVSGWVSAQAGSFQRFVTGYLPSAGTAGLGLVTGFRRH